MKKTKKKKSGGNFNAKEFLVQHVEKIVFGFFILGFVYLATSFIRVKEFDKLPEDLVRDSQQVQTQVSEAKFSMKDANLRVADYGQLVDGSLVFPLPPQFSGVFNPQLFPSMERRREPRYLPVTHLVADAGNGAIALRGKDSKRIGMSSLGFGPEMGGMPGMEGGMMPGAEGMMPGMEGMMPGMEGMMPGMEGMDGMKKKRGRRSRTKKKSDNDKSKDGSYASGGIGGLMGLEGGMGEFSGGVVKKERPVFAAQEGFEIVGRSWVAVRALVPVREQLAEYHQAFGNARHKDIVRDTPSYELFDVQRVEVDSNGQFDENAWQSLNVESALIEASEKWAGFYPELVDTQYVENLVCEPLPLLIGKPFDDSIGHPKIPMADQPVARDVEDQEQGKDSEKSIKKKNPLQGITRDNTGMGGGMMGGGMMGGGMMPGMEGMMGGGMMGMSGSEGMMGGGMMGSGTEGMMPGMEGMMGGGMMGGGMMGMSGGLQSRLEYKLFRFFDFEVEPGKTYRYRVRLVFRNPNYELPSGYLAPAAEGSPALNEEEYRLGEWSVPTADITVPQNTDVLAGGVKPARSATSEPKLSVMIVKWDPQHAVNAVKQFDVTRGNMLNFGETEVLVPDYHNLSSSKKDKVALETGSLLLDVRGGEALSGLPRGVHPPSEALIRRANGALVIRGQYTDQGAYNRELDQLKKLEEQKSNTKKSGRDSPMGGSLQDLLGAPPQ